MEIPFTSKEIKENVKNNKSTGCDGISAELLKQSPETIYDMIAEIYNETDSTGERPKEFILGTVCAIQKPGKKKGPIANLRPITLLSMLRKILAIRMKKRIIDRFDDRIPPSQAAYQKGRSTTEQVFAIKVMAEKAITSNKYNLFLLLLDMSKAFDTVKRPKLMEILSKLTESELHMMHILINDVIINVKISNHTGSNIHTKIGIYQGDCLSALLFILYLSNAIKPIPSQIEAIDYQKPMWSALDWIIDKDQHKICIDPKYADDISFLRSDESKINQIERIIPEMLKKEGLFINQNKTEKFTITRNGDESCKKCKYLGS